jgi:hypothetical protein
MPVRFSAELVEGRGGRGPYRFPSALVELTGRLKDWRGFWATQFIPRYLNQVQQNFETEGELSAKAGWPSLEPDYEAWKARHFPGTKILERRRRLRESLSPSGLGSRDQVLEARPTSLRLGTRLPYAKFHVYNRPFLVPITQKVWQPIIEKWIDDHAKKAKLK